MPMKKIIFYLLKMIKVFLYDKYVNESNKGIEIIYLKMKNFLYKKLRFN